MKSQNGKSLDINLGRLDRTEKKKEKKKSNREKDYGRLRSVNENEKKGQKKKNEKRRLN